VKTISRINSLNSFRFCSSQTFTVDTSRYFSRWPNKKDRQ